jgi:thiol:disulfide interchange protein DsbC
MIEVVFRLLTYRFSGSERKIGMRFLLTWLLLFCWAGAALAFPQEDCGEKRCADCHSLTREEAGFLLGTGADRVLQVEQAEMPGVWAVEIEKAGRKYPVYINYSKSHLLRGELLRFKDGENLTKLRMASLNRVDVSGIPLADALIVGDPQAKKRVIVFTDPQCHFCAKLHRELPEVVARDPEIAFYIKMLPLAMHPDAYNIAKSVVCNRSLEMLEDSFAGKTVPPPLCRAEAVDDTIALARKLGIRSTPTLVLPDGRPFSGYKKADQLLKLLDSAVVTSSAEPAKR